MTLHYALIRVFGLQGARSHSAWLAPVSALLALIVVGHFAYVSSLPLFPYGYHIAVAAALGMLGNLVWVGWSASFVARPRILGIQWPAPYPPGPRTPRRNWTPALLVALTIAAMSLELLDFPPILRVLDAHAAWHAATIPLALAWWDFLVKDALVLEGQATGRLD